MKTKLLLCLLVILSLFTITGCGKGSNSDQNNSYGNSTNGIDTGTYTGFKTTQCNENGCEEIDEEGIKEWGWTATLEVRSNKTATFTWTGTHMAEPSIVNLTIKKDKLIDDDGNEYSYSYVNGVITIESRYGSKSSTWSFK